MLLEIWGSHEGANVRHRKNWALFLRAFQFFNKIILLEISKVAKGVKRRSSGSDLPER